METSVDTSILVPSSTDQSTDLTAPSTTSVPSTGGGSSDSSTSSPVGTDLALDCNFDSTLRRIWCEASGFGDPASVTWGVGSAWGHQGGTFEYLLVEDWQLVPETVVTIEDCSGQSCTTLQVSVDTSSVAIPQYDEDQESVATESTQPDSGPARIESLTCDDEEFTAGGKTWCTATVSGDVDWVTWELEKSNELWNSVQNSDVRLQDALYQEVAFSEEGSQEVTVSVCTGHPFDPASCVEATIGVLVNPWALIDIARDWWTGGLCEGEGSQMLPVAPFSPEQLDWIYPLGKLNGAHPTPVSHQYWVPLSTVLAEVRAPASGSIVSLTNRGTAVQGVGYGGSTGDAYEVQYVIEVSCDLYLVVDHVIGVPDSIIAALGDQRQVLFGPHEDQPPRIPVSAGDLLGVHRDGHKLDLSVVDFAAPQVDGFARAESYWLCPDGAPNYPKCGEPFKLFERDSFEYFSEPLRSQLVDKSLRTAAPRGGFFVYDVDGTAQGTWFQQGTNGYGGAIQATSNPLSNYFAGHLALAPNSIEPSKLRVSIGDGFQGNNDYATQWGVTDHSPAFDTVTASSGPTTYVLRKLAPCDGSPITVRGRAREFLCNTSEVGTLMIELLDDRTMRVEVFFDVTATSGLSFTGNARTYLR